MKRKALGKGLSALLPDPDGPPAAEGGMQVPVESLEPNPYQPRGPAAPEALAELAASIRESGMVQPILVRRAGARYQIIAGERRWRAAKLAGLVRVPISVRDVASGQEQSLLEMALIENIQREDLNPVETATAFARMSTELSLSPDQIGMRTGKDRSTVVNFIRLLQLPVDIQQLIAERRLSAGHARCLLTLPDLEMQRTVAAKAVEQGWSVRQLEQATQKVVDGRRAPVRETGEVPLDPNVKAAIQEMERTLGTKVRVIERAKGAGRIEIEYYSQDDLDRIYAVIVGEE
jgi:ParB family chromosome partitioning protein